MAFLYTLERDGKRYKLRSETEKDQEQLSADLDQLLGANRGIITRALDAPARGMADFVKSSLSGAGVAETGLLGTTALSDAANWVGKDSADIPRSDTLAGKFGEAGGQMLGYVAASPIKGAGAVLGALGGVDQQKQKMSAYEQTSGKQVSDTDAALAYAKGAGIGALEGLLPEFIGGRLNKLLPAAASATRTGRGITGGVLEGGSEYGGNVLQDAAEQSYNDKATINQQGAVEQGGIGTVLGGVVAAALPGHGGPNVAPENQPGQVADPTIQDALRERAGLKEPPLPDAPPEQKFDAYASELEQQDALAKTLREKIAAHQIALGNPKEKNTLLTAWTKRAKEAENRVLELKGYMAAKSETNDPIAQEIVKQFEADELTKNLGKKLPTADKPSRPLNQQDTLDLTPPEDTIVLEGDPVAPVPTVPRAGVKRAREGVPLEDQTAPGEPVLPGGVAGQSEMDRISSQGAGEAFLADPNNTPNLDVSVVDEANSPGEQNAEDYLNKYLAGDEPSIPGMDVQEVAPSDVGTVITRGSDQRRELEQRKADAANMEVGELPIGADGSMDSTTADAINRAMPSQVEAGPMVGGRSLDEGDSDMALLSMLPGIESSVGTPMPAPTRNPSTASRGIGDAGTALGEDVAQAASGVAEQRAGDQAAAATPVSIEQETGAPDVGQTASFPTSTQMVNAFGKPIRTPIGKQGGWIDRGLFSGKKPKPATKPMPDGSNWTDKTGQAIVNGYEKVAANTIRSFADTLQTSVLPKVRALGDAVRSYVDNKAKHLAQAEALYRPGVKALKADKVNAKKNAADLAEFWQAYTHGDKKGASDAIGKMTPAAAKYADAAIKTLDHLGDAAVKAGVKISRNGTIQPFKKLDKYYPLIINHEFSDAVRHPGDAGNKAKVLQIGKWMVEKGKLKKGTDEEVYAATREFLGSYGKSISRLDDFYGNIERSRTNMLPPFIYDYTSGSMQQYMRLASERLAQIESFGQSIGSQKNLFQDALATPGIGDTSDLKEYIKKGAGQIYGTDIENGNPLVDQQALRMWGTAVTGMGLGAPGASINNVEGGLGNVLMFGGPKNFAKAIASTVTEYQKARDEGLTGGWVKDDVVNLHDSKTLLESGATKADVVERGINKTTDFLMQKFGFRMTENIVRMASANIAKSQLRDAIHWQKNGVGKARLRVFKERLAREDIDFDKLVSEGGNVSADNETGKYIRKMVNLMQGSYDVDQVPLYVNSPSGRLLFKFWKYNTQQTRLAEREFLVPFLQSLEGVGKGTHTIQDVGVRLGRLLNFLGGGALTGTAINSSRFWSNPAAEPARFIKAVADGRGMDAVSAAWNAGLQATIVSGSLGMASMAAETAQWIKDLFEDDIRTKTFGAPVVPATVGFLMAAGDLVNGLVAAAQGEGKFEDVLKEYARDTMRFVKEINPLPYAGSDALGESGNYLQMAERSFGDGSRPATRYAMSRLDQMDTQRYLKQWLEENNFMPDKLGQDDRTFIAKLLGQEPDYGTKHKELKKAIRVAIWEGNPARAKELMSEALQGLDSKKARYLKSSVVKSLAWYHPLKIDTSDKDQQKKQREAFLRYMADAYPPEYSQRIARASDRYDALVKEAGLYER